MLKLSYRPLAFTSYKAFFRWFYMIFEENYFCCYILLNDQISFLVAFTSWDIGKYAHCNCLITRLWRHKFWNWPYLSNQAIFSTWPKRSFYMIIFKGLSWKQIKQIFFERGESNFRVLKSFKISTDCHKKQVDLSNGVLFWKSLVPVFRSFYVLSFGFKVKPLRKRVFQC